MIGFDDDDCPCDLVFSYEQQACVIPCVPFDQPQAQIYTLYILLIIFSWSSFLCGWFYCITAAFRKELRQFPLSTTLTLQFVLSFSAMGLIFTGNVGIPYVVCESEVELADLSSWQCALTGVLGLFSAVAGIHAWTAFNFSILLALAKVQQKGRHWARWIVLAWVIVPATIAVSVLFGTDRMGAAPGTADCLIRPNQGFGDTIVWIFWTGPLMLWLSVNVVLMIFILCYIFKSAFDAGIPLGRLLRKQIRLFLFYLWFVCGVALTITNTLYSQANVANWKDNVKDYLLCVNTNLLYGAYSYGDITPEESCAQCELGPSRLPFGMMLSQLLLSSTLGLVCFLLLGFRKDIFKWWLEYWALAWKKKRFFVSDEMDQLRNPTQSSETSSGEKLARPQVRVQSAGSL